MASQFQAEQGWHKQHAKVHVEKVMMPPSYSKKYGKVSIAGSWRDVVPQWKRIPIGCPGTKDVNTENIYTSNILRTMKNSHIHLCLHIYVCKIFMIYMYINTLKDQITIEERKYI